MHALSGSQQNFAISDPSLPDNPIVYVSQGFLDLTGYKLDQVRRSKTYKLPTHTFARTHNPP
jgi:hypothetical protein